MGAAIESLNNAISSLTVATNNSTASAGVKASVAQLGEHWRKFWLSGERALMPDTFLEPKLQGYVKWYARAWVLVPTDVRMKTPKPTSIDVSWASLANDTLAQQLDSAREVAHDAAQAAEWVEKKAAKLGREILKPAANFTLILAGLAVVGVYFWSQKR